MTERPASATWQGTAEKRDFAPAALGLVVMLTMLGVGAGLGWLTTGTLAWNADAALSGVTGQLGETLPAAILVLLATAATLGAGAVLARVAIGVPFDGVARG